MNLVRRLWWRVLDDARFGVRLVCGRWRGFAVLGVVLRWLLHLLVGNLGHTIVAAVLVWAVPWRWAGLVWLMSAVVFEVWFQVVWSGGSGSWVHGWRLWWRVRRSLPAEWHESAVKSKPVQSGLGGEDRVRSLVRPVADHPKTAWWPSVAWPVVSAWVGHPPGRTSKEYNEFQRVLAANILRVDNVEFDFARDRDSVGRLQITFVDVLDVDVSPVRSIVDRARVSGRDGAASDGDDRVVA